MGTRRLSKLVLVVSTSVAMLAGVGLAHAAPSGNSTPTPGPTSLSATVDRDGNPVHLSWKTGLETTDVVERSLQPNSGFAAVSPAKRVRRHGSKASWRDSTVVVGTRYYYRVAGATGSGTLYSPVLAVQAGGVEPPASTTTTTTPGGGGNTGGNPQWWKGFGNPSIQMGRQVAVDGSGEATLVATDYGWVNFGPSSDDQKCVPPQSATGDQQPPSSLPLCIGFAGFANAGIVHLAANGTARWARALRAQVSDVDVDRRNGDVLVTGAFTSYTDFGGGCVLAHSSGAGNCSTSPNGNTDIYVARYTQNGALVWARNYGIAPGATRGWAAPSSIAVDPAGNAVVTGNFDGSVDFGRGTVTDATPSNGRGVFVASYSAAGAASWATGFSATSAGSEFADASGEAVATDAQGNVGITGFFKGKLNIGHVLDNKGNAEIFIAELSNTGAVAWSKAFGNTAEDHGTGVAFEPNGSLVATGYFGGTVNFGGGSLSNPVITNGYGTFYEADSYLVQFSGSGAHQWSKNFVPPDPNGNATIPKALTIGANGDIVLGGWLQNSIDFGGGPLWASQQNHDNDAFVAKFTSAGTHRWSHRWGTYPFDDGVNGAAVYANGEVIAVGQFAQQIGPLTLHRDSQGHGLDDGFILELSS